ncbi:MAG: hypothetical protein ACOY0T_26610 [Myxococcota bacterium]
MKQELNHRRRSARPLMLLLALFRALAVLLALQLGGIPHGTVDVLSAVMGVEEEHEQCPDDGSCNDCPAGCPNCHCSNSLRVAVPQAPASPLVVSVSLPPPAWATADEDCRSGPELPSLYRPPRTAA